MSIKLAVPEKNMVQLKPRISVIGVGGGGGNAVNNMITKKLEGVDFIVANTDAQALENSKTQRRIQLGLETTKGLGAGARPEIGKMAAEEALPEIERELEGANMVFITAGMGGGTGSGAAPVVAKAAKEKGILTVGVVTKPFQFEGRKRSQTAETALENFTKEVDSIIVIPNQNLFRIADKNTTLVDAFVMADNVLYDGVRSITDLMMMPGLINLDFADVKSIMEDKGKAIMGTGEAEGEGRAIKAAEQALANPLLDDCSMKGAKGVLI
ncbi:MAG: cell division protein FtsZ, partial [Alphaproteobacteria bacterium]|nr:cell division protein FtsZ [Alphaproteobacteria bacterium]